MDITTHGDFRKLYDTKQKRNYWVLGYFGGGSLNVVRTMEVAKQFAEATKQKLEDVQIDEVLHSRRYKGFKFMYTTNDNQKKQEGAEEYDNVWQMLTD